MSLKFYNTLSRSLEEFKPIQAGKVSLYTCGPTVYNYAHIGNFRAYIFEDILRRTLKYCGYEVTQVMNLTDVDDKTIRDSQVAKLPLDEFTKKFKEAFFEDLKRLRIENVEFYPEATKHILEMISMIQILLEKGFAYVGEDKSVYFSIDNFPEYGQLARIDLSQQRSSSRVSADEYGKESVADFALWKSWNEDDGDVYWDSPWGKGRPGWHIECSAMSVKYLGNHFDIHTGGVDNLFPHHEDEIAQCQAATGEKFVNYWLHCAHLVVEGQKMSKSAGNFFTLPDLLNKGFNGREIRWELMSGHYRQKLNFTFDSLAGARTILRRMDDFILRLKEASSRSKNGQEIAEELVAKSEVDFRNGLEDDLNLPVSIAAFFEFMKQVNKALDSNKIEGSGVIPLLNFCREVNRIFGVLNFDAEDEEAPLHIQKKVRERILARQSRDYDKADRLRDELLAEGWRIEDTPTGIRITKVI